MKLAVFDMKLYERYHIQSNIPPDTTPLYSPTETYQERDEVQYNGWIYKSGSADNLGNQPDNSPLKWINTKREIN